MLAMRYEVTLRAWEREAGHGWSGLFPVEQGGEYYRVVRVVVPDILLYPVYTSLGLNDEIAWEDPALARAVNRYAVRAVEDALTAGLVEPVEGTDMYAIELQSDDETIAAVTTLARGDKVCSYQDSDGRDLYCTAASLSDETATRVTTTGRRAAPTSRPLCAACSLPDTDYICSHFLHPQVLGIRAMGGPSGFVSRDVTDGLCDLNREEFAQHGSCHAGANPCWERLVDVDTTPGVEAVPPQAVEQALDDMNVRWRLAFEGRSVVRLPGAADVSVLALPCSSRDEFERRLSSLADIMKRLDIPNAMFPSGNELPEVTHTHRRLEMLFELTLADDDLEQVKQAVSMMRSINQLRVGGQHGGEAQARRTQAADRLGVPLDGRWGEAWERVRALAAHAIREVGNAARKVADQP